MEEKSFSWGGLTFQRVSDPIFKEQVRFGCGRWVVFADAGGWTAWWYTNIFAVSAHHEEKTRALSLCLPRLLEARRELNATHEERKRVLQLKQDALHLAEMDISQVEDWLLRMETKT